MIKSNKMWLSHAPRIEEFLYCSDAKQVWLKLMFEPSIIYQGNNQLKQFIKKIGRKMGFPSGFKELEI